MKNLESIHAGRNVQPKLDDSLPCCAINRLHNGRIALDILIIEVERLVADVKEEILREVHGGRVTSLNPTESRARD